MMDWKAGAASAVQSFDDALGRPPFPSTASEEVICKAEAVRATFQKVVEAGKLSALAGVREVTTTLPVLCASLREGSTGKKPCLAVYRPILSAAAFVSSLSTYPVSYLVNDAREVLGEPGHPSSPGVFTRIADKRNEDQEEAAQRDAADSAANEVALFTFMSLTQSLTSADVRQFLRMPVAEVSGPSGANSNSSKGKGKGKRHSSTPPSPKQHAVEAAAKTAGSAASLLQSAVPQELLRAMIDAPLSDSCRQALESFFDGTQKFLDVVGANGDLAGRILNVYGARIVPRLKPSSLLPCLDAPLLDFYVDVIAAALQRDGKTTLLTSPGFLGVPLQTWDMDRLHRLASTAASRAVRAEDAMASMLVYVFLHSVFCDKTAEEEVKLRDALATSSFAQMDADLVRWIEEMEQLFLSAVCKAMLMVLKSEATQWTGDTSPLSRLQPFRQTITGLLMLDSASVPMWLDVLRRYADRFLSRSVACAPWGATTLAAPREDQDTTPLPIVPPTAEQTDLCDQLDRRFCSAFKSCTKAPPESEAAAAAKPAQKRTPTTGGGGGGTDRVNKTKGKQHNNNSKSNKKNKSTGGKANANGADADSGVKDNAVAHAAPSPVRPPLVFSEFLASCCAVLLWAAVVRRKAGGYNWIVCDVARVYYYVRLHQPQRLSALLWQPFQDYFAFSAWMRSPTIVTRDGAGATPPAHMLAGAPLHIWVQVLFDLTRATHSVLWLSPLVLHTMYPPVRDGRPYALQITWHDLFQVKEMQFWLVVFNNAILAPKTNAAAERSVLHQYLYPAPVSFLLGVLNTLLNYGTQTAWAEAAQLAEVKTEALLMEIGLQKMRDQYTCEDGSCKAEGRAVHCFQEVYLIPSVALRGIETFLHALNYTRMEQAKKLRAAKANAAAQAQQQMHMRMQDDESRAATHRAFQESACARAAEKEMLKQKLREDAARRQAARAARRRAEDEARARRRQIALEALQQRAVQTEAEREAQRRQRFAAYQQRLQSEYRVTTFLEHLQLPSARVVAAKEALQHALDTVTPDDLLEYLVTGVAKVPADLYEESVEDAEVETKALQESKLEQLLQAPLPTSVGSARRLAFTRLAGGERRDFWAEVMDHPTSDAPPPAAASAAPQRPTHAESAPTPVVQPTIAVLSTSTLKNTTRSFHARVKPLLDLFCYDEGDEFGTVPAVLPKVRLREAARVFPPPSVEKCGFANVRVAFARLQERGVVQLRENDVQLTLLGFRYHFPYHAPEGMLEGHLREARQRVRAALARRAAGCNHEGEGQGNNTAEAGSDDDGVEGEEKSESVFESTSEEDEETDVEEGAHCDPNRLLPDVEFDI